MDLTLGYSRQLAASALGHIPADPELSILLALESLAVRHTAEAEDALRSGLPALFIHTTMHGHDGEVLLARYNADASRVVTASSDQTARIWNADTGELVTEMTGHDGALLDVAFSPDSRHVVTASVDKTVRVWDTESGALIHTLKDEEIVYRARFSPDGKRVVTAGFKTPVRLWDADSGEELFWSDNVVDGFISDDGRWIFGEMDNDTLVIWDANSGHRKAEMNDVKGAFLPGGLSKDAERMATDLGGEVWVWDVSTGQVLARLVGHDAPATTAAFTTDKKNGSPDINVGRSHG